MSPRSSRGSHSRTRTRMNEVSTDLDLRPCSTFVFCVSRCSNVTDCSFAVLFCRITCSLLLAPCSLLLAPCSLLTILLKALKVLAASDPPRKMSRKFVTQSLLNLPRKVSVLKKFTSKLFASSHQSSPAPLAVSGRKRRSLKQNPVLKTNSVV